MAIYTKQGDRGDTKVFDKKTGKLVGISKRSCKIRAIGTIDELNSFLGMIISVDSGSWMVDGKIQTKTNPFRKKIREVQANLFTINSILAGGNLRFSKVKVRKLERDIDLWEGSMPVLKNFIYYGGSYVSSLLFFARAICRRAERSLVFLKRKKPETNDQLLIYMNRLSDWLFMLARKMNFEYKIKEKVWVGSKRR